MTNEKNTTSVSTNKTNKKKSGIIRWNAIIPLFVFLFLLTIYFYFLFDAHVRLAAEWAAYKALGVEVNIDNFKSSFIHGKASIDRIQITDAKQPEYNSIEFSNIKFDVNMDALLKLKAVVEEITVDGVQFKSKRNSPGKVAPPTEKSNEPSFTQQLKEKALGKLQAENNLLGDIATFLKEGNFDSQVKNLESKIESKKLLNDLNKKWSLKKTEWDNKIKNLPTQQELNSFKVRFEKIKYKDFKSPAELQTSLTELDSLIKDVDAKNRQIQDVRNNLDVDLKALNQDKSQLEEQIKKDTETLKSHLKIPKIDAAGFTKSLFLDYLTPYTEKLDRYKATAQKYLPPKYSRMLDGKSNSKKEPADDEIQPLPRASGITYEFPIKNGYPLFWVQKINVSTKSNAQVDYGDFRGIIQNITSNQRMIGRPTTFDLAGNYNPASFKGIKVTAKLDNTQADPQVNFTANVASYPLSNLILTQSKDGAISIPNTVASLETYGSTIGFKNYDVKLLNKFNQVNWKSTATDNTVNSLLNQTLGQINNFDLQATASGELKNLNIDIRSSLGSELEKSFGKLLEAKVSEAKAMLQKQIDQEIGKLKQQFEAETQKLKQTAEAEVEKVKAQIDSQKKLAEARVDQAKKDLENKAKKQLEQEGQKAVDDLKKKFGF